MNTEAKEEIISFLDSHGIPYVRFSHPVTDTLPEKLKNDAAAGVVGAMHCKNLLLVNRAGTRLFLYTMEFGKTFRTGPDSRAMGSGRLSFASPETLAKYLRTVPGMVSPLELLFDVNKEITFAVDPALTRAERLCFHPADDTETLVFEREVFFGAVLPALGVTPLIADTSAEEKGDKNE